MRNGSGGRRRRGGGGGGGQRIPGAPRPDAGNRMEVRVRGNAAQLLEKYKQLARDASQAGDRVLTEYYLQFADHYYRVLNEFRARQEETRPQRQRGEFYEDDGDDGVETGPEPVRVSELTVTHTAPRPSAEPVAEDSEAEVPGMAEAAEADEAPKAAEAPAEAPAEEAPRRRRRPRTRARKDEAEGGEAAAGEMATVEV